jgi:hypothetical protein
VVDPSRIPTTTCQEPRAVGESRKEHSGLTIRNSRSTAGESSKRMDSALPSRHATHPGLQRCLPTIPQHSTRSSAGSDPKGKPRCAERNPAHALVRSTVSKSQAKALSRVCVFLPRARPFRDHRCQPDRVSAGHLAEVDGTLDEVV